MNTSRMNFIQMILFLLCICFGVTLCAEENFILIEARSGESVMEMGIHLDQRMSPCSTFKIALSLMGFDRGLLEDHDHPVWPFLEDYDAFLETWKQPQTPHSWMKYSCVWFSQVLATLLGMNTIQHYLALLDYGNQDISGGLTTFWLTSSLIISPREQTTFIRRLVQQQHPVSDYACQMTQDILFIDNLPNGWRLFGKTGWSGSKKPDGVNELSWVVGWIEKDKKCFPFAYNILESKINLAARIPRVKQLLLESEVYLQ